MTPDKLDLQASPANIGVSQSSELTAVVRDPTNNLVKNTTVDFSLSDLSAGSLSASSAVTNGQGVAKVTYTASSQASATRGVTVTARVRSNSAISNTARITVGATLLGIAADGHFVTTDDTYDCRYCDYASVCRAVTGDYPAAIELT